MDGESDNASMSENGIGVSHYLNRILNANKNLNIVARKHYSNQYSNKCVSKKSQITNAAVHNVWLCIICPSTKGACAG